MTIDEAIKHCEEVAKQKEFEAWIYDEFNNAGDEVYKNNCAECAADHRQLAEWLKELKERRGSSWISCEERMPEEGKSVMICSVSKTVHKATYDCDMGYFYIADSDLHYNELDVTHWQPLPEPPEV